MDYFTNYGNTFEEYLVNLQKFLVRCWESNLALINEKCNVMLDEGIVLGNHISFEGIRVNPTKI